MFKNKRFLIIFIITAIIFLIITGSYFMLNLQSQPEPIPGENSKQDAKSEPKDRLKEANFTLYNRDKTIRWELSSRSATRSEDGLLNLSPLEIAAYRIEDEQLIYSFTGEKGSYLPQEEKLKVTGPVRIEKEDYLLTVGELTWEPQENRITGQGEIKITGSFFTLTGDHLQVNTELNRITVAGNNNRQAYFSWKGKNNETETD